MHYGLLSGGSVGGHENSNLGHIVCFTPYLIDSSVNEMYLFEVIEFVFKSFGKNQISAFFKMAILCYIKARGPFC